MGRRKKVLQEIALDSDNEQPPSTSEKPVAVEPPAPIPEPLPEPVMSKTVDQPPPIIEPEKAPVTVSAPEPTAPAQRKSVRKRAAATSSTTTKNTLTEQRRESLRKANEARLRKKIEKEIAEKERARQEAERRMEQKVQKMVEEQMKRYQSVSYAPPKKPLSRRAIVKSTLRPAVQHYKEDYMDEDGEEDVDGSEQEEDDDDDDEDYEVLEEHESVNQRKSVVNNQPQTYQQRLFSQIFGK
jgi:hypothetical protein